jgi:tetratricopeptide (TPR) repeat protein
MEAAPDDAEAVFGLANVLGQMAVLTFAASDVDRGRALLAEAVGVLEKCWQAKPGDTRMRDAYIDALSEQGRIGEQIRDLGMAVLAYERLVPLAQSVCDEQAEDLDRQRALSFALNGAARMLRAVGNVVAAIEYFDRDLALLERLHTTNPEEPQHAGDVAVAHFNRFLVSTERADEELHLRAALEALDAIPPEAMPAEAVDLRAKAAAELEGLLHKVPEEQVSPPVDAAPVVKRERDPDSLRDKLVEEVELVLRERFRRRLPVMN